MYIGDAAGFVNNKIRNTLYPAEGEIDLSKKNLYECIIRYYFF